MVLSSSIVQNVNKIHSMCHLQLHPAANKDAPKFRGCPIIRDFSDTFICFQPHITIMAFIKRLRNQNWLFPPTIVDLIEEDLICRLVDDVVESIDFKSIEEKYDGPGSPAYHPKVMMKLLIPSGMHST
jgi:hypothetical protein